MGNGSRCYTKTRLAAVWGWVAGAAGWPREPRGWTRRKLTGALREVEGPRGAGPRAGLAVPWRRAGRAQHQRPQHRKGTKTLLSCPLWLKDKAVGDSAPRVTEPGGTWGLPAQAGRATERGALGKVCPRPIPAWPGPSLRRRSLAAPVCHQHGPGRRRGKVARLPAASPCSARIRVQGAT